MKFGRCFEQDPSSRNGQNGVQRSRFMISTLSLSCSPTKLTHRKVRHVRGTRQKTSVLPRDFVDDGFVFRTCAIFDDLAVEPFSDTPAGGVLHRYRVNETFL